jgi:hypothetical protein
MDSTAQTGHPGDWQEDLYQKVLIWNPCVWIKMAMIIIVTYEHFFFILLFQWSIANLFFRIVESVLFELFLPFYFSFALFFFLNIYFCVLIKFHFCIFFYNS